MHDADRIAAACSLECFLSRTFETRPRLRCELRNCTASLPYTEARNTASWSGNIRILQMQDFLCAINDLCSMLFQCGINLFCAEDKQRIQQCRSGRSIQDATSSARCQRLCLRSGSCICSKPFLPILHLRIGVRAYGRFIETWGGWFY